MRECRRKLMGRGEIVSLSEKQRSRKFCLSETTTSPFTYVAENKIVKECGHLAGHQEAKQKTVTPMASFQTLLSTDILQLILQHLTRREALQVIYFSFYCCMLDFKNGSVCSTADQIPTDSRSASPVQSWRCACHFNTTIMALQSGN